MNENILACNNHTTPEKLQTKYVLGSEMKDNILACNNNTTPWLEKMQTDIFHLTCVNVWQLTMEVQDFFSLCKIHHPAWIQVDHRNLKQSKMRTFWLMAKNWKKKTRFHVWYTALTPSIVMSFKVKSLSNILIKEYQVRWSPCINFQCLPHQDHHYSSECLKTENTQENSFLSNTCACASTYIPLINEKIWKASPTAMMLVQASGILFLLLATNASARDIIQNRQWFGDGSGSSSGSGSGSGSSSWGYGSGSGYGWAVYGSNYGSGSYGSSYGSAYGSSYGSGLLECTAFGYGASYGSGILNCTTYGAGLFLCSVENYNYGNGNYNYGSAYGYGYGKWDSYRCKYFLNKIFHIIWISLYLIMKYMQTTHLCLIYLDLMCMPYYINPKKLFVLFVLVYIKLGTNFINKTITKQKTTTTAKTTTALTAAKSTTK